MWTGDNLGTWDHMTVGVKMVLANGIAGMTFGGCECLQSPRLSFVVPEQPPFLNKLTSAVSLVILNLKCW